MWKDQIWTHKVAELRFAIFAYHSGLFGLYDLGIQTKVNFWWISSKCPQTNEKNIKILWFFRIIRIMRNQIFNGFIIFEFQGHKGQKASQRFRNWSPYFSEGELKFPIWKTGFHPVKWWFQSQKCSLEVRKFKIIKNLYKMKNKIT